MSTEIRLTQSAEIPNVREFLPENAPTPEIWIAGFPSYVGGADTELDHQITLWTQAGIEVNLCPVNGFDPSGHDPAMVESVNNRGCVTHQYEHGIFKDKLVFALCNDQVLKKAPTIALTGKPAALIWGNCMTWIMEAEKEANDLDLIDFHVFQSDYQRRRLTNELGKTGKVREWEGYRPWFDFTRFSMRVKTPSNYLGVGRISRDDPSKFHPFMWRMYGKVSAPLPVKCFVLGYGENSTKHHGTPNNPETGCTWLDFATWDMGGISAAEFFQKIDVLMHITGGSRENWPRCVLEAWANGVVPITDDDWGLTEMIEDGVTGFRCKTIDEAAYRASQLAFDDGLRMRMSEAGLKEIRSNHGNAHKAVAEWANLFTEIFNWS